MNRRHLLEYAELDWVAVQEQYQAHLADPDNISLPQCMKRHFKKARVSNNGLKAIYSGRTNEHVLRRLTYDRVVILMTKPNWIGDETPS